MKPRAERVFATVLEVGSTFLELHSQLPRYHDHRRHDRQVDQKEAVTALAVYDGVYKPDKIFSGQALVWEELDEMKLEKIGGRS